MISLLAALPPDADEDLLDALVDQGWGGVLQPPEAEERAASERGLEVVRPGEGEGAVFALDGAAPDPVARFQAEQPPPDLVLWGAGPDGDDDLAELVEAMLELGWEGALALRAGDAARFAALKKLAEDVLSEGSSWWDGTEDGY